MRSFYKLTLSLRFSHQDTVWTSPVPHTCHMLRPSHSSWIDHRDNIGEVHKSRSSSLWKFLNSPVTSSLLGPDVFLSTLFSNTFSLCPYLNVRDQFHSHVHSCQQKSIGLKFSKSQTGSDVRYSCHHNSNRFTFPIFAHSCRFCVLHSLQSITPRIY